MAKGIVFGVDIPKSVNNLNRQYIIDYLSVGLEDGSITADQVENYKQRIAEKTAAAAEEEKNGVLPEVKKSRIEREIFAELFMPELVKKAKMRKKIDLYKELDALLNK